MIGNRRQRPPYHVRFEFAHACDAGQAVSAVDVHRIRAAHPFAARFAHGQRGVLLFQAQQHIQQHPVAGKDVDVVILQVGMG